MSTPTFDLLKTITLTSPAASIDLTSIPFTHTHLYISMHITATPGFTNRVSVKLNSTNGSYSCRYIFGSQTNGNHNTFGLTNQTEFFVPQTASLFAGDTIPTSAEIWIRDYNTENAQKSYMARLSKAVTGVELQTGKNNSLTRISSILFTSDNNHGIGTTISIYGVH